jgi:hypothetical protein
MGEAEDNDIIIIALASVLRNSVEKAEESSIHFPSVEENYELPSGSVAKHLDEAAKDAGVEITRRGSTRASFRRKRGGPFFA